MCYKSGQLEIKIALPKIQNFLLGSVSVLSRFYTILKENNFLKR